MRLFAYHPFLIFIYLIINIFIIKYYLGCNFIYIIKISIAHIPNHLKTNCTNSI